MKTHTRILTIAAMAVVFPCSVLNAADACCPTPDVAIVKSVFGAPPAVPMSKGLTEEQSAFLAGYETLRAALAGDDFEAAKKAAEGLHGAEAVAKADSIAKARVAFKAVSANAIAMAKGRDGFYVAHCPMVKGGGGDWVQTSKKISNPYYGSQMLTCGSIKS